MNVSRDPMLLFAITLSLVPAVAFVLSRDAMDEAALAAFGMEAISHFVGPVVLVLPATLIGWVTGFLLLEDRDDGVLLAVDVTPVGKAGFLLYRVTVAALISGAITTLATPHVVPGINLGLSILIVAAVAVQAVLAATILPAVARNKVEGLALTKLTSIAAIVPLVAAIPSPWRLLGGIVPTYWVGELLVGQGGALPMWVVSAVMILVHLGWTILVLARLDRRVG
ncbi:MAG TPA: hypothetical protein VGO22_10510 [Pseudorhizobium sp.]|nr:hypothetical protein [Pseudorhizobium sp.]